MKLGYFGSPPISAALLGRILEDGHEVAFVVTNPDRPRGRSGSPVPTEVAQIAQTAGIPTFKFERLREAGEEMSSFGAELYVVFAYGKIIPADIFRAPAYGTINLHGSLLPAYRGASPIQSALLRGESRTGWCLQFINEEMDAGDIIASCEVEIDPDETAGELAQKMLPAGIELTLNVLRHFDRYSRKSTPQNHSKATYCSKISSDDAVIDWSLGTGQIHNSIRAFNPSPVARSFLSGRILKIYRSRLLERDLENQLKEGPPGKVLAIGSGKTARLLVRTGDGWLEILELQPEGKKILQARDFLNGFRPSEGTVLGAHSSAGKG